MRTELARGIYFVLGTLAFLQSEQRAMYVSHNLLIGLSTCNLVVPRYHNRCRSSIVCTRSAILNVSLELYMSLDLWEEGPKCSGCRIDQGAMRRDRRLLRTWDTTTSYARITGRKRRRKVGGRGISAVKKCRCWCCRLSVRCRCGAIRLT